MEEIQLEKTIGPTGSSANISRKRANVADHKNHALLDFVETLVDHHQDLVILETDNTLETLDVMIEIPSFQCTKCRKQEVNVRDFVEHYLEHEVKVHRVSYEHLGVVKPEINDKIKEVVATVQSNGNIKKKVTNSNFTIRCSLDSPLASFLSMQYLKIYLDEVPSNKSFTRKYVKVELQRPEKQYNIHFDFTFIDRAVTRIKTERETKKQKKLVEYYEKKCQRAQVAEEDLLFKKNRTEEETKCLALALNLPENFTHMQLYMAMKSMADHKPNLPENTLKYDAAIDQEGNYMTKEQRKLISTLSNNFMYVSGSNRRCTRKKPVSSTE